MSVAVGGEFDFAAERAEQAGEVADREKDRQRPPDQPATQPAPKPTPRPVPPPTAAPRIESLTTDATANWLRQGQIVHVRLFGTPGGQATFHLPGLIGEIPMREAVSGTYTGEWQVPAERPTEFAGAPVIGDLRVGGRTALSLTAPQKIRVDAAPPQIRDRSPEPNTHVGTAQPNLYAVFEDNGSGVDTASVRLVLDNQNVTREAQISSSFVSYRPGQPLPTGRHTVELLVADRVGNRTRSYWSFTEDSSAGERITRVTDNADHPFRLGDTLHIELTGAPGGQCRFSVGSIHDVPLAEVSRGHYSTDYGIRNGDSANNARVVVRLMLPDGHTFFAQSGRGVVIVSSRPAPPNVLYPRGNARVGSSPLALLGTGMPNTRVHLKLTFRRRNRGNGFEQGTLLEADAVPHHLYDDSRFYWSLPDVRLPGFANDPSVEFTLSAVTRDGAGQASSPVNVRFYGGR